MTLLQLSRVKRWLLLHGGHPIEAQTWDLVLMVWVLGWTATPPLILMSAWALLPLCLAGLLLPGAYVAGRLRLHRRGWLRCDWLTAL